MTFAELRLVLDENETKSLMYKEYFRTKKTSRNTSIMIPPEYRDQFFTSVSFCRLACQVINERIELDTVTADTDPASEFLNTMFEVIGGADFVASAHLTAMEFGRSYLIPTGSLRSDGSPMVQIVPGRDMVHDVDPLTGEVREALRVVHRRSFWDHGYDRFDLVYYNQDAAFHLTAGPQVAGQVDPRFPGYALTDEVPNTDGVIPVFPLLCRGEPNDPFGRPEAKDVFTLQDSACRSASDMSFASGTLAAPQRGLVGAEADDFAELDPEGNKIPGTEPTADAMYMSRWVTISEPGAKFVEFTAAQLQNFTVALNAGTRQAAAIMGIPVSVFGVASDANPASGDSMTQDDKRLVRRSEQLTRGFEPAWKSMCEFLLKAYGYGVQSVVLTWVDPSLPNLAGRADAVQKLSTIMVDGGNLYSWKELRQRMGDSADEIKAAQADREVQQIQTLLTQPPAPAATPVNTPPNPAAA